MLISLIRYLESYLNNQEVRELLGVDKSVGTFTTISWKVNSDIDGSMDLYFPTQYYLGALLERGVRVLLYTGVNDFGCNWVGVERLFHAF